MHAWMVSVVILSMLLACGRDRSSGAAPAADTGQMTTPDTSPAAAVPDNTGVTAAPDSTVARGDTGTRVAGGEAARKPAPKPVAPKPAPTPAAPAPARGQDTTTSTPAETTAAAAPTPTAAAPTTEASAPLRDQYHQAPRDTVSQQVYDGWKQFNLHCARCHGEDVQGTTIAPHLLVSVKPGGPMNSKEAFVQTVCAGRPEKGMPAWCALGMETPTIEAIHAYVKGRSDSKIHPGRPALKAGG
jgi:mono/diheme cytochrome c family protein